jgi:asparagine synthase (glutamine-hydrolysing)
VTLEFMLKRFLSGAGLPWFERHVGWFGTGLEVETVRRSDGQTVDALPPAVPPSHGPADVLDLAMRWDYVSYLRDHLLAKIDRATSLVALESRAPYLDADLTRLAWRLPPHLKVHGLTTKRLLRDVARRWLPRTIVDRRKRGLSVPVAAMLNGSLASTVDRVLAPERLSRQGLLNASAVSQLVAEHRRGRLTLTRGLWTLFVLQLWMEHWMPEGTG